jgi:hypothetical protein
VAGKKNTLATVTLPTFRECRCSKLCNLPINNICKLNNPNLLRLHLLNSGHIQEKIEKGPKIKELISAKNPPDKIIENLYLTILSRRPTKEEKQTILSYGAIGTLKKPLPAGKEKPQKLAILEQQNDWNDIVWALINSPEFLYRH